MRLIRGRGRLVAPVAVGLVLIAQLFAWSPMASAQQAGQPVDIRGFATGQTAHVTALEMGGLRIADAEVAWSGSSVDGGAAGLDTAKLNEVNRIFQPAKPGKLDYARGSGVEVGLTTTPKDPNGVIVAGLAEADAPPSSSKTQEIAVPVAPLVYASVARGQAVANSNDSGLVPDVCVLGDDLSRGIGYAADVQLLDTGSGNAAPQLNAALLALDDQNPDRAVSQSTSHEKLVPSGTPNNFGLMSEERQTIAPITVLQNRGPGQPPRTITIEVLGEWVLRAVATGKAGGASVFYGPGKVSPSTPILRIIDSMNAVTDVLSFQQIFGPSGFTALQIPGVLDLTLGEAPRAIAKPGTAPDIKSKPETLADGTQASAAVDVARVRLLSQPDPQAADVRVGHMEVSAHAPAGGVDCPIPVTKSANPDSIKIKEQPDTSHIGITVHNVFNCDLTGVTLTDHIKQKEGTPNFKLTAADPTPDSPKPIPTGELTSTDVVWSLGTIPKGTTKDVSFDLQSVSQGGVIEDIASATGKLQNCTGSDAAGLAISGLAIAGLDLSGLSVPVDVKVEIPVTGAAASRTAATGGALAVVAIGLGFALRRRFPRRI